MLGILLALALAQGDPLLNVYRYPPGPVEAQVQPTGGDATVSEFFVTYPSLVQTGSPANDRVAAFYFVPRTPGRHPVVLILHALGSRRARLEQWIGREFAHRGLAALVLVLPYHMMRKAPGGLWTAIQQGDADGILAVGVQAILDLRRALDWLETREEIASDRMGVVGISLGAIGGAIALGVDDRVKAGVLILGGADPAHLVWTSWLTWLLRWRLARRGLTEASLRARWRALDPVTFAAGARGKAIYMINARFDFIIPRASAKQLWEALGRPPIEWLPTDHYTAYFLRRRILDRAFGFLHQALSERDGTRSLASPESGWPRERADPARSWPSSPRHTGDGEGHTRRAAARPIETSG